MIKSSFVVQPLSRVECSDSEYDLIACSCGFESRSRFVAEVIKPKGRRCVAASYTDRQVHSYADNRKFYGDFGYEIDEVSGQEYATWVSRMLEAGDRFLSDPCRIMVDISSLSRSRISAWVEAVCLKPRRTRMIVDFVYAFPRFELPSERSSVMVHAGPVSPAFAGTVGDPESPLVAMLGVGFEQERALGAIEYVDPSRIWLLWPYGGDGRYQEVLETANENLVAAWDPLGRSVYNLHQPYEEFIRLESLVFGLGQDYRIVFLPFGPKLLTLLCLLVAGVHRDSAVWRLSPGETELPLDVAADGEIAMLRVSSQSGEEL